MRKLQNLNVKWFSFRNKNMQGKVLYKYITFKKLNWYEKARGIISNFAFHPNLIQKTQLDYRSNMKLKSKCVLYRISNSILCGLFCHTIVYLPQVCHSLWALILYGNSCCPKFSILRTTPPFSITKMATLRKTSAKPSWDK